jgi:hypothetical protein
MQMRCFSQGVEMKRSRESIEAELESTRRRKDALELYLHDRENGVKPSATAKHRDKYGDLIEADWYRPTSPSEGYVVIRTFAETDGRRTKYAYIEGWIEFERALVPGSPHAYLASGLQQKMIVNRRLHEAANVAAATE